MSSTASTTIIDWIIAVPVAPQQKPASHPAPAPAPQLPAPNHERLLRADVMAEADRRGYPRPYYLTLEERRVIAEQLDLKRDQQRAAILHKCGHVNMRDSDCGYGTALCTPSQSNTITGRG